MKNVLYKLNMVKNHNKIAVLEQKNRQSIEKTQELVEAYKKIINDYELKINAEKNFVNDKISALETENSNLKLECEFYKSCLEKIPKFVLRIFVGKNKKLLNK